MTVRLGILGAARIPVPAIIDVRHLVPDVEVVAVAARDLGRAASAATAWNVPQAYGSYEELLADADIDAVYIATPSALHRPWTVAALEAGKHVLCEKPFASNGPDARTMVDAAERTGLVLMEALHWRYHPMAAQMRSILDGGTLGRIERVDASFEVSASFIPETDIRYDLALGGGAMMDIGVYPASWVRWIGIGEPRLGCGLPLEVRILFKVFLQQGAIAQIFVPATAIRHRRL